MRTRKMRAHFLCHMRPEILAPAGTPAALLAAIRAGADAIYLGGSLFSARAFAGNFNQEELLKAIEDCHLFDVKLYMTVNTLMKEKEMSGLVSYMKPFYQAGLDGVIVQDVGCAKVLQEAFPDLALHASTQMSISSAYGAALLKAQGFKRVVPARELSLAELKEIKEESGIEIETFVHGAMCFSYSGKCLLSSFAGGRSGNRGRCAQPCRKCYDLLDVGAQEYAMSMKDMCTLRILPDLIEAGIDSFKIEGRMKNPVYVASTVNAYKKARDYYLESVAGGTFDRKKYEDFIRPLEKELADIYNRGGFSEGYYYTEKGPEMMANERANTARLKTPVEFAMRTVREVPDFEESILRLVLQAIHIAIKENENPEKGLWHLKNNVNDYWNSRDMLKQLLSFLKDTKDIDTMPHWAESGQMAEYIYVLVDNDHV